MDEIVELRSKNSKSFDLGDGQVLLEVGNHAHVMKNGLYIPVNNTMDNETGIDPDTGYEYDISNHSTQHPFYVKFGKGTPSYFKMKVVGDETTPMVVFKPLDSNAEPNHLIEGSTLTVYDVWNGIDVSITLSDKGIKTNYLIKSAAGQRQVRYEVSGSLASLRMERPWYVADGVPVHVPTAFSAGVLTYDFTGVPVGTLVDPTTNLQPDSAGFDSYLDNLNATTNSGTAASFYVGDIGASENYSIRSVLKFDLSSITSGAVVTSATCTLTVPAGGSLRSGGPTTGDVKFHKLLRNWVESQVTWNIYSTGNNWATAGAAGAGTDINSTASATSTFTIGNNGTQTWDLTTDVAAFVAGSATNYGWLIKCAELESLGGVYCYVGYSSSDNGTSGNRPALSVTYTVPSVINRKTFSSLGTRIGSRQER